jgi:hypothetical protein
MLDRTPDPARRLGAAKMGSLLFGGLGLRALRPGRYRATARATGGR